MFKFNTIEEALEDLRNGKLILCTDDPDRENEGDFICAAEFATTENVMMHCVFPGWDEVLANVLSPHSILIRLDLPTFDRPMNANSGMSVFGHF